ncbi:MAG: galactokinase [Oscillospiraceae bacterium]|nr:galactokinase [Oscillospiraceae bacterium]
MEKRLFSAPGRVEIGGNHTDHQHGVVLAAAVDLEVKCTASKNSTGIINIENQQYGSFSLSLDNLDVRPEEKETAAAVVRGVAAWFKKHGHTIGGFDASVSSTVPVGSGLSSSAAFEVLIGNVFKGLYGCDVSPLDIALAGKYAENEYFGKPCGLMDQAASSFGGLNLIDFADPDSTVVTPINTQLPGYLMCIVETGGSHADLTAEYAAIPHEMKLVAGHFGYEFLNELPTDVFYENINKLRAAKISDRAILRSIHFFEECLRAKEQAKALQTGDIPEFLSLINKSGLSSLAYLQNVFTSSNPSEQGLTLALALSEKLLAGKGAWRVHGGGFAGTILAFVPTDLKDEYNRQMSKIFGKNFCHFLNISNNGGREIE